ncbi:MAG: 2-amino-4-hydroxy-6-hydroxymethyldihydropteridine diphosphokinase [Deltaproteobacteria bacterium]|nr:2-amino-4-hydroxy-6-hydroxymethyldihydropteridine diphosphokinase [Deltaproteobacteria bacterium]
MESKRASYRRLEKSQTAYIGIGSNLGDSLGNCQKAVERIVLLPGCELIRVSGFYLTEPVGVKDQGWYVNAVMAVNSSMSAHDLMRSLLKIEADMGRVRRERWEPRVIDIDLLLYGMEIISDELLVVPHPMMHKRRFVMAPMAELSPDLVHVTLGKKMSELLGMIPANEQAVKYLKDG